MASLTSEHTGQNTDLRFMVERFPAIKMHRSSWQMTNVENEKTVANFGSCMIHVSLTVAPGWLSVAPAAAGLPWRECPLLLQRQPAC